MLSKVEDDTNCLQEGRSCMHRYKWPRSRPDVMIADLYYNTVEGNSTEHITDLEPKP